MFLEQDWVETLTVDFNSFSIDQTKASIITPFIQQLFVSGITPGHFGRCVNQISQKSHLSVLVIKSLLETILRKKGG
jgi:hypothetical protein